jgi:hypothetical protein
MCTFQVYYVQRTLEKHYGVLTAFIHMEPVGRIRATSPTDALHAAKEQHPLYRTMIAVGPVYGKDYLQ